MFKNKNIKSVTLKNQRVQISLHLLVLLFVMVLMSISSCKRDLDLLEPAQYPTTREVFIDGFSPGLQYQAFSNSKLDAFDVDNTEKYKGSSSMQITVPDAGDPSGWFAGGAFISSPRDLSGYNALTFWGRASQVATIGLVGLGNDNTGDSKYEVTRSDLSFTTVWKKYIIPIPDAGKLDAEQGMFEYAVGADEDGNGFYVWFDEVQFEKLGTIAHPRPTIPSRIMTALIGDTIDVGNVTVTFDVNGVPTEVQAMPSYFTYSADNDTVVQIKNDLIKVIGSGTAVISARLGSVQAEGSITVNVTTSTGPAAAAPTPTIAADSVISLFSNAYSNHPVDTWNTGWEFSTAVLNDITLNGDDVKLYTNLNFVGIEFASQTVDATEMTNFHLDIWTPDPTDPPAEFKVLLVDFGADGAFDGGDDSQHEITINSPTLQSEQWVSLDIPLSEFTGLSSRAHLAQLVLSGDPNIVYVDNVYFHNTGEQSSGGGPAEAAPTPDKDATDVISLFSNAYTDVAVDTWSAEWDNADVSDIQIAGNDIKKYSNLVFAGVEFTSQTVDATDMSHFHMDIWTPDPTALPVVFKIKLVDFGADAAFDGGDDVEHELTLDAGSTPAIATESWVSLDIPLSDFSDLTTKGHLAQLIISGDLSTVYIDNIYFYTENSEPATEPSSAAATPTFAEGDVISLFSNAYTDITVDTWSAEWDNADVSDVQIAGDDIKKYSNLVFAGIEFVAEQVDASEMTHFYMNVWTPDPTAAPAVFKVKLVDFGADGTFDGGDDVEHELSFNSSSSPAMTSGSWVTLDIPLADFANMTTRAHVSQLIISGDPNTVWVDNILFHK